MRLAALAVLLLLAGMAPAPAQHHETTAAERAGEYPSEGEHGGSVLWKWANFALLAGVLGWALRKHAGPFFAARTSRIRQEMEEAERVRAEASRRIADVEAKLAGLGAELDALRREAGAEQQAESVRFRNRTAAEMAKIEAHARQEIEAAAKQERLELRRYASGLALELAERKIRAGMTSETQELLVNGFVAKLGKPAPRQTT